MKRITVSYVIGSLATICFYILIFTTDDCDTCFSFPTLMLKLLACGMVIFIGSLYFKSLYLKNEKRIFNIEMLPLLEPNEATEGIPFSCEGTITAETKDLLQSPYSDLPCVYYHCITEKYVKRGKNSGWEIVENLLSFIPFYIADDHGKIKVDLANMDNDLSGYSIDINDPKVPDPENSEIDCLPVIVKQITTEKKDIFGIILTTEKHRRSEYIMPPSIKVFAYGYVSRINNELILHEHEKHSLIISQKTKEKYIEEYYRGKNLVFLVNLFLSLSFTVSAFSINYFLKFNPNLFIAALFLGNGIFALGFCFAIYNRLIILRQRALVSLSEIDIELKRRCDLIPQITELVKEYTEVERELAKVIVDLKNHIAFQNEMAGNEILNHANLLAVAENYPALKSSVNYRQLMKTLVDIEERIVYSRAFYNRNVRKLNTLISQFPFAVIAMIFRIKSMQYISIRQDNDPQLSVNDSQNVLAGIKDMRI